MDIGTVAQIFHDIDKDYISNKGTRFSISPQGALFKISMNKGGKAPRFCDELFTSYKQAEAKLEAYLKATDRLGYAVYPSKERNGKS